jgi:hypothetical protein
MLSALFALVSLTTIFLNDIHLVKDRSLATHAFLTAEIFIACLPLAVIYQVFLANHLSSLRKIPCAPQEPLVWHLFKEPNSVDMLRNEKA